MPVVRARKRQIAHIPDAQIYKNRWRHNTLSTMTLDHFSVKYKEHFARFFVSAKLYANQKKKKQKRESRHLSIVWCQLFHLLYIKGAGSPSKTRSQELTNPKNTVQHHNHHTLKSPSHLLYIAHALYAERPARSEDRGSRDVRWAILLELVVLLTQVREEVNVLVHVRNHLISRHQTTRNTHKVQCTGEEQQINAKTNK